VPEAIHTLGQRLHDFWDRYRSGFKTQTRDASAYARHYLSGLLRLEGNRHGSGIGREAGVEGQHLQHLMSHSPWSAEAVYRPVQDEGKALPELTSGAVLLVDESANAKASDARAGAAKPSNGRLGKVETSPVGVLLSYVNRTVAAGFWTWLTGTRFLPEAWFEAGYQKRREPLGIPDSLRFKTQVELAWDGIQAVITGGLPFEIVGLDSRYGRSGWLRAPVRQANQR
jgi:SRSO17 transposase